VPHVTDTPPPAVQRDLAGLEAALDEGLPPRTIDRTLLVATWNVRVFGGLTEKWVADPDDSPKRDLHSLHVIAAIIRRFDVVAIQEVKGNLKALRHTMKLLGRNWGLLLTDVTRGSRGHGERLAFLYDRRTVQPSGLAGELVVPQEQLDRREIDPDALDRQFARTPYAASFRAGNQTFVLVTLHVWYGDSAAERTPELRAIAEWLDEWAREMNGWSGNHNLIALGDFNIDRRGNDRYEAFTSTGLTVPDDLHDVPRTLSADPADPAEKFYDQIAWFTEDRGRPALSLSYRESGSFDFRPVALPRRDLDTDALGWRISDHYPLWVAFGLD
jgi:endonuclease/exonuclease/phosphatase family metal-dependent hydrolase